MEIDRRERARPSAARRRPPSRPRRPPRRPGGRARSSAADGSRSPGTSAQKTTREPTTATPTIRPVGSRAGAASDGSEIPAAVARVAGLHDTSLADRGLVPRPRRARRSALFVVGVWRLERLEHDHRAELGLARAGAPARRRPRAGPPRPPAKVKPRSPEAGWSRHGARPKPPDTTPQVATTRGDRLGRGHRLGAGPRRRGRRPTAVEGGVTCDPRQVRARAQHDLRRWRPRARRGLRRRQPRAGDGCSATCTVEPPRQAVVAPTVLQGLRIAGRDPDPPARLVKTADAARRPQTGRSAPSRCASTTGGRVSAVTIASSTQLSRVRRAARRGRPRVALPPATRSTARRCPCAAW